MSSPTPPPFAYSRPDDTRRHPHYSPTIPAIAGDGYFAQQALQAGLYGGGVPRRPAAEEQWRREAEKERIREELLAREAAWRRELEEEVRRELAAEREEAFRRGQAMLFPPESARPLSREGLFRERPSWPLRREVDESLFQAGPEESRMVEDGGFGGPKPRFQSRRNSEATSRPGIKRMFSPASSSRSFGVGKPIVPERKRKGWYCDVCQVTANSLQVYDDHLRGKKHKEMEAEALQHNMRADPGKGKSHEYINFDAKKMESTSHKGSSKQPYKQRKDHHFTDRSADQFKMKRKKFSYFCNYCEVGCFSKIVMASHYRGKKHSLRMEELKKSFANNSIRSLALEDSLKEETAGVVTSEDKRSEESNARAGF